MPKAIDIAIVSGGLDSTPLAYLLHAQGYELHVLSFDYGQRHKKELAYAERWAKQLRLAFDIVDLSSLGRFLKGSALTDIIPVPMLIPGVATKVERGIAVLAGPAMKGKKLFKVKVFHTERGSPIKLSKTEGRIRIPHFQHIPLLACTRPSIAKACCRHMS